MIWIILLSRNARHPWEQLPFQQILSLPCCQQPTWNCLARYPAVFVHYSLFWSLKRALFTNTSWLCIVECILKTSWAIQKHMKAIIILALLWQLEQCQLYMSLFKCTAVTWVMEKIQKLQILCPVISQTLQTQLLPSLFMTKCQNNSVLFHAFW